MGQLTKCGKRLTSVGPSSRKNLFNFDEDKHIGAMSKQNKT